jgi:cation/acetate symporter
MSDTLAGPAALATEKAAPLIFAGLSAAAIAMPVVLLVSLPGLVFLAGFDHLAFGLALLAGVVLAGLLIAPNICRAGAETATDALFRRFGKTTAVAAAVVILLVALPVLAVEFTLAGLLADAGLGLHHVVALAAVFVVSAAMATLLEERRFRWLAMVAYLCLALSLLAPLVLMASSTHGAVIPYVTFPQALAAIGALEEKLVENGLVDFDTFSVHITPFARLSGLDLAALVVSVALGVAVLPHLLSTLAKGKRAAATRFAGAWTTLFVMLVLVSIPALAAYAKLAIYTAVSDGTPLASLPAWLEAPLRADLAHIHGTSLAMLEQVAKTVATGIEDPAAIAEGLAFYAVEMEQRWSALAPDVQAALIAGAKSLAGGAQAAASVWEVYVTTVLPVAATATGNEAATLTQAALVIEPAGLLLALPALSGAPAWGAALILAGLVVAAIVAIAAQIRGLFPLAAIGAGPEARPRRFAMVLVLIVAALAAVTAMLRPHEMVDIVVASLSLAAAGLFPVLALGLGWKRATTAGAVAAIVLGAGVTLYYDAAIQVYPASFYKTWASLSNASESAIEEFNTLEAEVREGETDEAKATAQAALETLARGSPTRAGLANWAGVDSASGAIFGVPVGLLVLIVVSLVTPARRREMAKAQP